MVSPSSQVVFHIVSDDIGDNPKRGSKSSLCQLLIVRLVSSCNLRISAELLNKKE